MIDVIETLPNPKGIIATSPSKDVSVIACPEKSLGRVRVVHFDKASSIVMIEAHQSAVAALSLNNEGTLLATASDKVTFLFSLLTFLGNINKNI